MGRSFWHGARFRRSTVFDQAATVDQQKDRSDRTWLGMQRRRAFFPGRRVSADGHGAEGTLAVRAGLVMDLEIWVQAALSVTEAAGVTLKSETWDHVRLLIWLIRILQLIDFNIISCSLPITSRLDFVHRLGRTHGSPVILWLDQADSTLHPPYPLPSTSIHPPSLLASYQTPTPTPPSPPSPLPSPSFPIDIGHDVERSRLHPSSV